MKGLNLMVLIWKHIEKCGTKGTQMTIGATTIGQEENRTMSQVNQVLHMMGMTEMAEIRSEEQRLNSSHSGESRMPSSA